MAHAGTLIGTLGSLPADLKKVFTNYTDAWVRALSFGTPGEDSQPAGNFGGHLVPFVTAGVANGEVAVAHGLERQPRWIMLGLDPNTVNAIAPVLTTRRVADKNYFYVSSDVTSASVTVYVE